jgi:phospholipid/cholesterol/gamma-HCH transport system substrate-binding protein
MRRRDPLRAGVLGVLVLAALVLAVFRIDALPIGGRTTTYRAELTDAGGLEAGDPVEVSGIEVGSVSGIDVDRTHVVVSFRVDHDVRLGRTSRAAVKVGSLLGAKYLELEPAGPGRLEGGAVIPLSRTTPAYDIVEAFEQLTTTTEEIDKAVVARALDAVSSTFRGTGEDVRGAVRGLADLSATIADRDAEVRELLAHARGTTQVLAERRGDVRALLRSTDLLLAELDARRDAIRRLLTTTSALTRELDGLVADNERTLTPALRELRGVVAVLEGRQKQLRSTLRNMEIFTRVFTNTIGSGPWFDALISNIPTRISLGGDR